MKRLPVMQSKCALTSIQAFLGATVAVMVGANPKKRRYNSLADFVLQNGRSFSIRNAKANRLGPLNECFSNAQRAAAFSKRHVYCEGYAIGCPIPVLHGWLIRLDDMALIETTWDDIGTEYFGIPFNHRYMGYRSLETGSYHSLIDDWRNGWPLMGCKKSDWLHPKFRTRNK